MITDFFVSIGNRFSKAFLEENRWQLYLEGLGNTIMIAVVAAVIGVTVGVLFAMVSYINKKTGGLKVLTNIIKLYVTVVRGTPVVLQMMLMYFVIFSSWDNAILIGGITFGLNSGAYVSEIARAAFGSVDDGQREAGRSLGLSNAQTMWHIIIPQALRNSLPPLFNEFIALVKETAVVGYVGVSDLGKIAGLIQSRTFDYLFPVLIAAVLYLVVVMLLTLVLRRLEKKFAKSDR